MKHEELCTYIIKVPDELPKNQKVEIKFSEINNLVLNVYKSQEDNPISFQDGTDYNYFEELS